MAKPIEFGLVLKDEDARRFHKYMEHPTYTQEGKNMILRAAKRAKQMRQ